MSSEKQPLEGLTIRLWNVPSESKDKNTKEDNLVKGNRGYRQYTEQVGKNKTYFLFGKLFKKLLGSEKLKYSTHDWEDKPKKGIYIFLKKKRRNTRSFINKLLIELKKSTRDWDAEKKKLESVQDLPLLSRSDVQTDSQRCEK